ncbi:MAG TPA: hypothetical protein VLE96_07025 [Chlamydiales bacterium]|nr:hypothetical protein [Chlamydiales bacterium]
MSDMHADSTVDPSEIKLEIPTLDIPMYRNDPHSFLPLNSDPLSSHLLRTLNELDLHIEEEKRETHKLQKQIAHWEERIRGNYFQMGKNVDQIKNNQLEASHEILHRDYWWGKESLVLADFSLAKSSNRPADWAWLIKKYGLKNAEGILLDAHTQCIEEVCLGAIRDLVIEYKEAGVRYDLAQSYKRSESEHLTNINAKLSATNKHLRNYINNVQSLGIEPIQDGIQFLTEFGLKLKTFEKQESPAKFGEMRAWAEEHLDQFLKKYPSIPHRVVSTFRSLASIPLPFQNS